MSEGGYPILLYHGIGESSTDAIVDSLYAVPEKAFRSQLRWLRENGFSSALISDMLSSARDPGTAFVLTVDDCLASAYERILPALLENGFRATFFAVAGSVGAPGWVDWGQLGDMRSEGMEVGSHSMTHADLSLLGRDELREELEGSKKLIEDKLGVEVTLLSLPGGYGGRRVVRAAREAGYRAICSSVFGYNPRPPRPYALKRFCIRAGDGVDVVRWIVRGQMLRLLPRYVSRRGSAACRAILGRKVYGAVRGLAVPQGAHRTLPRFPR